MKYKLSAFLWPLVGTFLLVIAWISAGFVPCGVGSCSSSIYPFFYYVASSDLSIFILIIYIIFVVINIILGISAIKQERSIETSQGIESLRLFKKIRVIRFIGKFSVLLGLILLTLVNYTRYQPARTRFPIGQNEVDFNHNCQAIWNPEINDFVLPLGC